MADSKKVKDIVNQVAMQAATVVMMAFRDTEMGSQPATIPNQWENQRQRNGGLQVEKPRFNLDMPDRHVELLHFQLDVMNILETRAYKIDDEQRTPVIKNWLGWEGLLLMETVKEEEKKKCKTTKGSLSVLSYRFRLHHNHIILSLQYQKLQKSNMPTQELMGRL